MEAKPQERLISELLVALEASAYKVNRPHKRCFVGFDGFTDTLVEAVKIRYSPASYAPFPLIEDFAKRLADSAGRSCNVELKVKQVKIGGNAPLLAQGLVAAGYPVIFAGTVGVSKPEPLFIPLTEKCEKVFCLAPSGASDAIEFEDGKIILGKQETQQHLTLETLLLTVAKDELISHLNQADLIATVNWTMLPMMNKFWEYLLKVVLPKLDSKTRALFIDFADPAKRGDEDLLDALNLIEKLALSFRVILGVNLAESDRLCQLLHLTGRSEIENAELLRKKLNLFQVAVHTPKKAIIACNEGIFKSPTFFTSKPAFVTGAGDHFNAGLLNGVLREFPPPLTLLMAIATSGWYVRHGTSPSIEELAFFLKNCDKFTHDTSY